MYKTLEDKHLEAMPETIAGFLNDQVLNPNGEFYFNPDETWKPKL